MTHNELIDTAKRWLQSEHTVVITDMTCGVSETPDAIGWKSWGSTLIECKTSLGDFKKDMSKHFRKNPARGMGNYRYFLTPQGLLTKCLLPIDWGLLEVIGQKIQMIQEAKFQLSDDSNEIKLLLSAIRRIGKINPGGVSVKHYSYTTKNRATLGIGDYPMPEEEG